MLTVKVPNAILVWDNWVILVNVNNLAEKIWINSELFIPQIEEAGSPFFKLVNAHYYLFGIVFFFWNDAGWHDHFLVSYDSYTPFVVEVTWMCNLTIATPQKPIFGDQW